jgi:hypothetical protein
MFSPHHGEPSIRKATFHIALLMATSAEDAGTSATGRRVALRSSFRM